MDNYYYLPPDAWTLIDFENEQLPEPEPQSESYFDLNPMLPEPEVDWDQWVTESGLSPDQLSETAKLGSTSTQGASPYADSMQSMSTWPSEASAYSDPVVDDLEQLLFSSPESSQLAYTSTSTSTPISSSRSHSSPNISPMAASTSSSPTNSGAQGLAPLYSCHSCPKEFPKRHLLK